MLLKQSDSWDVKSLRTIVLLYSEANHTYKFIGIETRRASIDHGEVYPEQYRRPQISDVAHGINRRLIFDYQ